ncbi:MAG: hypothetical protein WA151_04870 [Desulfatirhabdiaceae bacterium]|jgi:hypothetical protein
MKLWASKQLTSITGYSLLVIVNEDNADSLKKFIPDVSITMKTEIVDKIVELINNDREKGDAE